MTNQSDTTNRDVLRSYPIEQVWKRGGFYVARFTGSDPKYRVGREFLQGKPVKTRKTVEYTLTADLPAWVLRRPDAACHHCGQTRPVKDTGEEVIAAYQNGWVNYGLVFGADDLLAIHEAGPPGGPRAWAGDRCPTCDVTPIFADEVGDLPNCETCDEAARAARALANLPDGDVY